MRDTMETPPVDKRDLAAAEWRTRDMALAAYLGCIGYEYVRMEHEDDSCYWVFVETDEMPDQVFTYLEGRATVEPNAFNSKFAALKRDMFDYGRRNGINFGRRT